MHNPAVLFIAFNRPDTTQEVFNAIRAAKPKHLYIAIDAPRIGNKIDIENCNSVRKITEGVDWECEAKYLIQKENLGCSLGVRTAFKWFFEQEKEGVILEDDCVPHIDFFSFAAAMLDKYRENKKIISINGSNLGFELKDSNSYTFSRFMNMWGWATWSDRANVIDYSLQSWKDIKSPLFFLHKKMRNNYFDADINWYKYWKEKFDLTQSESITWWDWQWVWHQIEHKKLSIIPAVNLVTNIGFNAAGTHTHQMDNPAANIPAQKLHIPLKHPKGMKWNYVYEEHFVKWVWCYYKRLPKLFYIKRSISKLIRRK